jgi:hypothetical protein
MLFTDFCPQEEKDGEFSSFFVPNWKKEQIKAEARNPLAMRPSRSGQEGSDFSPSIPSARSCASYDDTPRLPPHDRQNNSSPGPRDLIGLGSHYQRFGHEMDSPATNRIHSRYPEVNSESNTPTQVPSSSRGSFGQFSPPSAAPNEHATCFFTVHSQSFTSSQLCLASM